MPNVPTIKNTIITQSPYKIGIIDTKNET